MLIARVVVEGRRELRAAEVAQRSGDFEQAAIRARRAASWYAPGAPHVPAAYRLLASIARQAEGRGDTANALFAWRATRFAVLSSRWIVVPHSRELDLANAEIARLSSKQPRPPGVAGKSDVEVEHEMLDRLTRREHPRPAWVVVMLLAIGLVGAGFARVLWRGLDPLDKRTACRIRQGLWLIASGAVAWALALWLA